MVPYKASQKDSVSRAGGDAFCNQKGVVTTFYMPSTALSDLP